jgi:hypothetical protein
VEPVEMRPLSRRRLLGAAGAGAAVLAVGGLVAACGSGGGTANQGGGSSPATSGGSSGSAAGGGSAGGGNIKNDLGSYQGGVVTLNGDGSDIWQSGDNFVFADQPWTKGDGDWSARIVSLADGTASVHEWSKFGIMVRDSMDPMAACFFVAVTGNHGVIINSRPSDGGQMDQQDSTNTSDAGTIDASSLKYPVWLRVTRKKNTFQAYTSTDGKKWNAYGQTRDIPMSACFVGIGCLSHTAGSTVVGKADQLNGFAPTKIEQVGSP